MLAVVLIRAWQQRHLVEGPAPVLPGINWQEKTRVVHFWATWCPVCRAEQSQISTLVADYPETVTVAWQSGPEAELQTHLTTAGLRWPVINDPNGGFSAPWGIAAVPTTFVVDRCGQIRAVEVGYTTELGLRLRRWWADWSAACA